jgi:pyrroline-5-carboxylate reductase
MEKLDIHIVGLGNLGSAFINGLKSFEYINLFLYDDSASVRQSTKDQFSVVADDSITFIQSGVIILCIKPQNINDFFNNNKDKISSDVLICSPVAGLEIRAIESFVDNKIIRVMPNLLIRDNHGFIPYVANYDDDYFTFKKMSWQSLALQKNLMKKCFPLLQLYLEAVLLGTMSYLVS